MKLAIGTAQFGLRYGIANTAGQVPFETAAAIVRYAAGQGIDTLDTAIAYGDSEERLGCIGIERWHIVSKLPAIPDGCPDVASWVRRAVGQSLEHLRVERLYGLLLHRPHQLLEPRGDTLYSALQQLKSEGLVCKIGVSIYDPAELDALHSQFRFDLVQAPLNLFDQRLLRSGWHTRLAALGAELHTRSVFLQGLLLMKPAERPAWSNRWAPLWRRYAQWLEETALTPLQACIRSLMTIDEISRIVVGVDNVSQLQEIVVAAAGPAPAMPAVLASDDPELLNPGRWP